MLERRRSEVCLSDLTLDRLRLGELAADAEAATAARAHLETCSLCLARLRGFEQAPMPALSSQGLWQRHQDRARANPPGRSQRARFAWQKWWLVAPGAALVLGALALLVRPAARPPSGERSKGATWSLTVIARHPGGVVERVGPGASLSPGDQLRFEIRGDGEGGLGHVAIISFDPAGAVTAFVPASGSTLLVTAGRKQLLDGAVVLDDVLGAERIMYLACPSPLPVADVVKAAKTALTRAGADPTRVGDLGIGCSQGSFWIRKVQRR